MHDELIEQLDRAYPLWRVDYGLDPISAAYELGLLTDDDIDELEAELAGFSELDFD